MYQALYRKWRPKNFDDVSGQKHITDTLKNQLVLGKLSHAYLFSGSRGTGKTSTAKILARAVNCLDLQNGNPCNECSACRSALDSSAVDIIEMDAASNNSVDDARTIIDEVVYTPAELKKKVYIIDEAHMLTTSAFNALLKTLEEPPEHVLFIFATTEPHQFPPTILSRCQRFDFKRITPYDAEERMKFISEKEGFSVDSDALSLIARISDGAMRDALGILDQCFSFGKKNIDVDDVIKVTGITNPGFVYEFTKDIIGGNVERCFLKINDAYESGRNLSKLPDEIINVFRNMLVAKTISDKEKLRRILSVSSYELEQYIDLARDLSSERIIRYIDVVSKATYLKKSMPNPRLALEIAVMGIAKEPDSISYEGIAERISELENKIKNLENRKFTVSEALYPEESADEASYENERTEPQWVTKEPDNSSEKEAYEIPKDLLPRDLELSEGEDMKNPEEPDYPIMTEEFAQSASDIPDYDIKSAWNDVVLKASKNSLMGFDKVINSTKKVFVEDGIEFYFSEESFYTLAKTCKFDENIKNAFNDILKRNVAVRFIYDSAQDNSSQKEDDTNFGDLISKLSGNNF